MRSLRRVKISALDIDREVKEKLIKVLGENEVVYIEIINEKIRIII